MERERTNANFAKEKSPDSGSKGALVCGEENGFNSEESLSSPSSEKLLSNVCSEGNRKATLVKKVDGKVDKQKGQHQKERTAKPPLLSSCAQSLRMNSSDHLHQVVMSPRRTSGHNSD